MPDRTIHREALKRLRAANLPPVTAQELFELYLDEFYEHGEEYALELLAQDIEEIATPG